MADAIMVHKCLRGVHRCDQHEEGGTDDRLSYIALMIDGATHSAQAHMKNAERIASRAKVLEVYDDFCEEVEALIAPDADSLLRADCIK